MTTDEMSTAYLRDNPQAAIDALVAHYHHTDCIATAISNHYKQHCNDIPITSAPTHNKLVRVRAMLQQNGMEQEFFYAKHPGHLNTGYFKDNVDIDDTVGYTGGLAVRKSAKFILLNSENELLGEPFLAHHYHEEGGFDEKTLNSTHHLVGYFEHPVEGATRVFHTLFTADPIEEIDATDTLPVQAQWPEGLTELLKMWAISKAQLRTADGLSIGSMAVNIYNVNSDEQFQVCREFLGKCFPAVKVIKADGKSLSTQDLVPEFDADTLCLRHRELQVPEGTCLLIDERQLECGELDAVATKNIKALLMIATQQRVQYAFPYCLCDIDVDHPVLVVSSEKSLVPCHWHVDFGGVQDSLAKVPMMREYVQRARNMKSDICEETARLIEADYLQRAERIDESKLHSLLTLSRLIAVGRGSAMVLVDDWHKAVSLAGH